MPYTCTAPSTEGAEGASEEGFGDMSGVYEKDREEVPALTRFRDLAKDIDDEATRVAAKVISKNYRFVIGVQLANAGNELAELADESYEHYPSNILAAYDRKRCYSQAVAKAKTVKRLANKAMRQKANEGKAEQFKKLIADAGEFINIAHGLKKSVKVKGIESLDDVREWLLAQLEAVDLLQKEEDQEDQADDDVQS